MAQLWLWRSPAAVALIHSLAWEPPHAVGGPKKEKKRKKKKKNESLLPDVLQFPTLCTQKHTRESGIPWQQGRRSLILVGPKICP